MWPFGKQSTGRWGLSEADLMEIYEGRPIQPRHAFPSIEADGIPSLASEDDVRFFSDFADYADLLNCTWLSDTPWRLEQQQNATVGRGPDPIHGRAYDLFYNRVRLGKVEISACFDFSITPMRGYAENPTVELSVELSCPLALPFHSVEQLLNSLARWTVAHENGAFSRCSAAISRALIAVLWDGMQNQVGSLPLEIRLAGAPTAYLAHRAAKPGAS